MGLVWGLVVRALIVGTLAGCGTPLETATEMPKTPRQPDGVAILPETVIPEPADRAPATGIVALRAPASDREVEEVVRAYLQAFEHEDIDRLIPLLSLDAAPIGRSGGRGQLIELFRQRMRNFEYERLGGAEVAEFARIDRQTFDSLGAPGARARPPQMKPGDLYIRVPIAKARVDGEQLFGDVLVLLLRRENGKLRIAGQADENAE